MNKPSPVNPVDYDDDIGPLDANGQQLLSPEDQADLDRLDHDPAFLAAIAEAEASIDAGDWFTNEEVMTIRAEQRRQWLAERNR
jgi:hypothetical protein